MKLIIRKGFASDWDEAVRLAYQTFLEYIAPDYGTEGRDNFHKFLYDPELYQQFAVGNYQLLVATDEDRIVGMLLIRESRHISLLFVDGDYQRRGVGNALVSNAQMLIMKKGRRFKMTVNAEPSAVSFYEKEGFVHAGAQKSEDGISYWPMEKKL